MMPKKNDKALHLDIPFEEALNRFVQTDPHELEKSPAKTKKLRRPSKSSVTNDEAHKDHPR
jgi:hypothetical protein